MSKIIYLLFLFSFSLSDSSIGLNRYKVHFPSPTKHDLDKGFMESHITLSSNQIFINIDSQEKWTLYIKSASLMKVISNNMIQWKVKGQSNNQYQFLSNQKTYIKNGMNPEKVELVFRLNLDWFTQIGNYNFDIILSLDTDNNSVVYPTKKPKKPKKVIKR